MPAPFDPERHANVFAPLGVIAAVAAFAFCGWLGLALAALAAALFAAACTSQKDGFLVLGPFIRFELRRSSRRSRVHLWRGLLAGVVGGCIVLGYAYTPDGLQDRDKVAVLATVAFLFVAWHLFLVVFSIAVTLLTQAVAAERDAKTLDFLLASDLRNREIILGKAVGRLLAAISYPLAAVPLLLMLPILFGVDAGFVLYTLAYAAVTLVSISGLAILSSVAGVNKKRGGAQLSLVMFAYIVITGGLDRLSLYPAVWFFPGQPQAKAAYCVGDVIDLLALGNPMTKALAAFQLATSGGGGAAAGFGVFIRDFPGYAAFHVGVGLIAALLAIRRLRTVSARLAGGTPTDQGELVPTPPVGDRPIVWKERYFHPQIVVARRVRRKWLNRALSLLLIGVPLAILLAASVSDLGGRANEVRIVGRFYLFALAGVTALAASQLALQSIVREREKDTLTSLILTDIPPREILRDKFRGLLGMYRGTFLSLGGIALATAVAGALPWWSIAPILVMLLTIIAAFAAIGFQSSATAVSNEEAAKSYVWKMIPFASPAAFIPHILDQLNLASGDEITLWLLGIAGMTAIYGLAGWLFWRSAVCRFVRACDPAAESGPLLEGKTLAGLAGEGRG